MVNYIYDIDEVDTILSQSRGSSLRFFLYGIGLKRLLFRVQDSNKYLFCIAAVGCEHICGKFDLSNIDLSIIKDKVKLALVDKNSDFKIVANSFCIITDNTYSFDKKFQEDFIFWGYNENVHSE